MGFTPQEIDGMSMWQYLAALEGWVKSNTSEDGENKTISTKQADEIWDWMQTKQDVPLSSMRH